MPHAVAMTAPQAAAAALFYLFAGVTGGSAIAVVVSRNIVRTAVFLLFTLAGAAGLYFLLDAEFLAAVQLVVYAGGTLILIVFGVMLTSKSPFRRFEPKLAEVIVAVSVAAILLGALVCGILNTMPIATATGAAKAGTDGIAAAPVFPDRPLTTDATGYPVAALGQALLGDYLVPFELASVLLLVVMIGAAFLAKGRRREMGDGLPQSSAASKRAREWS